MQAEAILESRGRTTSTSNGWRAWHVFLHAPALLERLLIEVVRPEVDALPDEVRVFFIRYWENGPHVRLRVDGLADKDFTALGARLSEQAARLALDAGETPGRFGPAMRFDVWHADPAALPWLPQGTVAEIMYEPEYRRYGGPNGLCVNEALFVDSSALALALVAQTDTDWPRRETLAIKLTAVAIGAAVADLEGFIRFADGMAGAWASHASGQVASDDEIRTTVAQSAAGYQTLMRLALEEGAADPNGVIGRWRARITDYLAQLRALAASGRLISPLTGLAPSGQAQAEAAIQAMLLSQIHMTNNRLGIPPQAEFLFGRQLSLAAQAEAWR